MLCKSAIIVIRRDWNLKQTSRCVYHTKLGKLKANAGLPINIHLQKSDFATKKFKKVIGRFWGKAFIFKFRGDIRTKWETVDAKSILKFPSVNSNHQTITI